MSAARSNIRRGLLTTADKALLTALPETELESSLRRHEAEDGAAVDAFVDEVASIRESGIAINVTSSGSSTGVATLIRDSSGGGHLRRPDLTGLAAAGHAQHPAAAASP